MRHINKSLLSVLAVGYLAATAGHARADFVTSEIGGAAETGAGISYLNLDSAASSYGSGSSLVNVAFAGNGGYYNNSVYDMVSQPYISGYNGNSFGSQNSGVDTTNFLTSGVLPTGSATLTFATTQNYFGLLWGSMDSYNTLTFYKNGVAVSVEGYNFLTGYAGASGGAYGLAVGGITVNSGNPGTPAGSFDPDGNDGYLALSPLGTAYVNIGITGGFNEVSFTSTNYNFEADNIAYGNTGDPPPPTPAPSGVPDGGMTVGLLGLALSGIAGFGAFLRKRPI
jgi:hypothetical protein